MRCEGLAVTAAVVVALFMPLHVSHISHIAQPHPTRPQVHSAVLHDGRRVALKIQYPGVARSIESDVDNLMRLISIANVLPRGMYVENAVKVRHTLAGVIRRQGGQ